MKCRTGTFLRLPFWFAARYVVLMENNNQDEYLRSLMPHATEAEIAAAKEAIADFLELIWQIKEEREAKAREDKERLDREAGAC